MSTIYIIKDFFDDMSSKWHLNLPNDMELVQTKTIQDQTRHNHTKYFKTTQKRIEKLINVFKRKMSFFPI